MERKSFNTKAKITNKRSNAVGQKLQTESALLEAEKKEEKPWCVLEALCTFWLLWKTQQIHGNNVSKNTGKKFASEPKPACANYDV